MSDPTFHYALLLGLGGLVLALWRIGTALRALAAMRALATLETVTRRFFEVSRDDPERPSIERMMSGAAAHYGWLSLMGPLAPKELQEPPTPSAPDEVPSPAP